jgi:hypothetical protein
MFDPFLEILVLDGSVKLNNSYYIKLRETLTRILTKMFVNIDKYFVYYGYINKLAVYLKLNPIESFYMTYPYDCCVIKSIKNYRFHFFMKSTSGDVYQYYKEN